MNNIIPFQMRFSQELPQVVGNVDYTNFRKQLERILKIINDSKIEEVVINYVLKEAEEKAAQAAKQEAAEKGIESTFDGLSIKAQQQLQYSAVQGLRCNLARRITQESYRIFSTHIADSPLLQKFCLADYFGFIQVPSKSQLQRYDQMIPEEIIHRIVVKLNQAASNEFESLGLKESVSLEELYMDTTCLSANIHFPVDWLLMRDAVRTLMKATILIRNAGLKNRMEAPEIFISKINKLCIQMTHSKYKKGGRKERKRILRLMKKLVKKVRCHAQKHRALLEEHWQETELKEGEVRQIIRRIANIINQIPEAVRQAHERIIGERAVKNSEKILSLYEPDINVIVRGKAGAEVEFGNSCVISEQRDGLIVDWQLYQDKAPGDAKILAERLDKMNEDYDGYQPKSVTTDRGFFSKKNQEYLKNRNITDYMCPRPVTELQERLAEQKFCNNQQRRGQTEGRIGILKHNFFGSPIRSKGFANRKIDIAWSVLTHNLWVLARLPKAKEEPATKKLLAA